MIPVLDQSVWTKKGGVHVRIRQNSIALDDGNPILWYADVSGALGKKWESCRFLAFPYVPSDTKQY